MITHTHTHTHVYLTKQATRKGEAPIVLATRDRLTDKKEIDRITNKLMNKTTTNRKPCNKSTTSRGVKMLRIYCGLYTTNQQQMFGFRPVVDKSTTIYK